MRHGLENPEITCMVGKVDAPPKPNMIVPKAEEKKLLAGFSLKHVAVTNKNMIILG